VLDVLPVIVDRLRGAPSTLVRSPDHGR